MFDDNYKQNCETLDSYFFGTWLMSFMQQLDEVMECLVKHRCRDVTLELDPTIENVDIARGGFGIVYSGRLLDGTPIAIKCLEGLTNRSQSDRSCSSNLKVTPTF